MIVFSIHYARGDVKYEMYLYGNKIGVSYPETKIYGEHTLVEISKLIFWA